MHLLDRGLTDRVQSLLGPTFEVGELARGGVDVDDMLGLRLYVGLTGVLSNTGHKKGS